MTREINRELARQHAEKLGDLHDDLVSLLYGHGQEDESMRRSELARLVQWYGHDNVRWMLGVIREDSGAETEI